MGDRSQQEAEKAASAQSAAMAQQVDHNSQYGVSGSGGGHPMPYYPPVHNGPPNPNQNQQQSAGVVDASGQPAYYYPPPQGYAQGPPPGNLSGGPTGMPQGQYHPPSQSGLPPGHPQQGQYPPAQGIPVGGPGMAGGPPPQAVPIIIPKHGIQRDAQGNALCEQCNAPYPLPPGAKSWRCRNCGKLNNDSPYGDECPCCTVS